MSPSCTQDIVTVHRSSTMVLLDLCWGFCPAAALLTGRKGLRGDPESAHPLAVLDEPSAAPGCGPARWGTAGEEGLLPSCSAPAGRLSLPRVSYQKPFLLSFLPIGWSQHEPHINLFSGIYRLRVALVMWLNPSLGLFDFTCVVIFIRWPGISFPSTLILLFMWDHGQAD